MTHQKGFTLIELVLVILIVSVMSVIGGRIIYSVFNSLNIGTNAVAADWQARVAMERMIRDFRAIPSQSNLSNTSTASKVVFTNASGTTMTYSLSGTQLLLNTQVLADNIQSVAFAYYDANGAAITPPPTAATEYIKITLTVNVKNITFTLTSAVYPWNFS